MNILARSLVLLALLGAGFLALAPFRALLYSWAYPKEARREELQERLRRQVRAPFPRQQTNKNLEKNIVTFPPRLTTRTLPTLKK